MWTFYKRNRPPPLRASHNKRNPPPPACAVRMSRGMGPPYKVKERSKETKRNEMIRGLDGDVSGHSFFVFFDRKYRDGGVCDH
jgi:hypothetical protein